MNMNKPNKAIGPQVRQKHNNKANKQLIALVVIASLISMQIGTQYAAYKLYHADTSYFSFAQLYLPWQAFIWSLKYNQYYSDIFNAAFGLMVMSGSIFLMMIVFVTRHFKKENVNTG